MRINRYIARSGVTSRRKAEELIKSGKVLVNGNVISELSTNISKCDKVTVSGKEIKLPNLIYLALNKPTGYTTTKKDRFAKKTVFDLLPNENSLISVGRLDKNTSGLLIITNDGNFAQNIIHPSNKIEKEYEVITKNILTKEQLHKIDKPIKLNDGSVQVYNIIKHSNNKLSLTIEEGRNRIVRRIIKKIGNEVKELKRTRVGIINLDIKPGDYRKLTIEEVREYV